MDLSLEVHFQIRSELKLISGRRFLLLRPRPHARIFLIINVGVEGLFTDCINVIPSPEEMSVWIRQTIRH